MKIAQTAVLSTAILMASGLSAFAKDPLPSNSDAFVEYSVVGDWTVYADQEKGTCLVERMDENGNVFQMGLTKNGKHGYIGIFTTADIDIKKKQKIEIDIDGHIFDGKGHGIKSKKIQGEQYSGGYFIVKDKNLGTAIAEGQQLIAFPKKTAAFVVDLTGTKKAIEEGRRCNLEQAN